MEPLAAIAAVAAAVAAAAAAVAAAAGLAMVVTLILGALYSYVVAFSLASLLSAVGPSLAYFLFMAAGKPLVVRGSHSSSVSFSLSVSPCFSRITVHLPLLSICISLIVSLSLARASLMSPCLSLSLPVSLVSQLFSPPFPVPFSASLVLTSGIFY